jgi:CRISPR-associated protein Cmr4
VAECALVASGNQIELAGKIYLEDLDLAAQPDSAVRAWAAAIATAALDDDWHKHFVDRFAVLSDDVFTFLTETGTEVVARIKLKEETKTVQGGALWYEEAVPSEAIFAAPVLAAPRNGTSAASLLDLVGAKVTETVLQIGGNATVGRGLVRARLGAGVAAGVTA